MAIRCEFIDVIIPIETINRVYKGGYKQFRIDRGGQWGCEGDDGILYTVGSMGTGIDKLLEIWIKLGLVDWNGQKWVDYCISESFFGGAGDLCDWLITYGDIAYSKPFQEPEKPKKFPACLGDIDFKTEESWMNFHRYLSEGNPEKAKKEVYTVDEKTGLRHIKFPGKE